MPGSIRAALETVVEITDMRHIPRSDISNMIIELEADMRETAGAVGR
jgi:excinuclease ABC subunit B